MDDAASESVLPLRRWLNDEESQKYVWERRTHQGTAAGDSSCLKRKALLRKTTVAYGIVELLRRANKEIATGPGGGDLDCLSSSEERFDVENFVIRLSSQSSDDQSVDNNDHPSASPRGDIRGVSMVSPALSGEITELTFLSSILDGDVQYDLGRYLEVTITPPLQQDATTSGLMLQDATDVDDDCNLFGILLYELYSGVSLLPSNLVLGKKPPKEIARGRSESPHNGSVNGSVNSAHGDDEPRRKKKTTSSLRNPYVPLQELGSPSSVSSLVSNLIDGHDAYTSLEAASEDIHLMLSDPACFLFDVQDTTTKGGSVQLSFRKHKLYGRENEVSLITDAFCRVSSGENEAFFIGGYSGSGKTKLVRSVKARVDISGGYVLTQKADQMHRERPLMGVLSAFNHLCTLIREKNTPQELDEISAKLKTCFESDFSLLVRLLPNVAALSSESKFAVEERGGGDQMNFHNVCFLLQRFLRVVSSEVHPVMLFLDDLQWAPEKSLELIHAILSDKRGSNCFFFVGSYRDNEVDREHPIFTMMFKLDSSGVSTTRVSLEGLSRDDLNTMISDAMCMLPRICEPLSNVVFQKTKGNPMFSIEFLRSLVDSRQLEYSLRQKMWTWDIAKIRSENITDNVLYLLSRKMTSFPRSSQLALKVLSCFGIKVDGSIIEYLSLTSEYSNFREWLDHLISEGCILKVGASDFKFVHDKVQEAAYSLIPQDEKKQLHFNLGLLLYSVSRERGMGGAIFQIVDQINHGMELMIMPEMRKDLAELNLSSGSKAMDRSDFDTALTYLNKAFSMLSKDHWSSSYELSLRLYLLTAKAAYSCGNIDKAYVLLKEILQEGRCLEDKLDAYCVYVTILTSEGRIEAWATCCEVLAELNETIPDYSHAKTMKAMVKQTREMLGRISLDGLLEMQEMDSVFHNTLKFYTLLLFIAFWKKPQMTILVACRMIKLSLDHGVSKDSVFGFVQYAAAICLHCNSSEVKYLVEACRIGKAAMSLLKRYGSSADIVPKAYLCYYGFVAPHMESLQLCTKNLRKGYEVGMSTGDPLIAIYISLILFKLAMFSGENLHALLKDLDYYLEVMNRFHHKLLLPYLLCYRETILTLIGQSDGSKDNTASSPDVVPVEAGRQQIMFINRALQSFWCGHSQRCHYYSKKALDTGGHYNKTFMLWIGALNSFRGIKNKNGTGSQFLKVKDTFKDAIAALRSAAELSRWNFQNKVYLLEAEMFSFERQEVEARASYAAAITSSSSSRFVHEQGLSCELAGLHYIRLGESETALNFLQRAKDCYQRWGSQMKVESIDRQMEKVITASLMAPT